MMHTRVTQLTLFLALLVASSAALTGCDALQEDTSVTLSGTVRNGETGRAIDGVQVQLIGRGAEARTDSSGAFRLRTDVDTTAVLFLAASKFGYAGDTVAVRVTPGGQTTVPDIGLRRLVGTVDPTVGTGPAASISLAGAAPAPIGVRGGGANETATLVFVARDADGFPVDAAHAADLEIRFGSAPGGGEFLSATSVTTDENGEARVTVTAGTRAGVAQVIAEATVGDRTVRSIPVSVVIHGGLPDRDHFSLAAERYNLPGRAVYGDAAWVTAYVGDRYSNPVRPGTVVYFETTGGIVQGSATTDANGQARVQLFTAAPSPSELTVTARTVDDAEVSIEHAIGLVFSGRPEVALSVASSGPGRTAYALRVSDDRGYPLSSGTAINVQVDGQNVAVGGQTAVQVPDATVAGPGTTDFTFYVSPDDPEEPWAVTGITVTVTGPNGNLSVVYGGRVQDPGPLAPRKEDRR